MSHRAAKRGKRKRYHKKIGAPPGTLTVDPEFPKPVVHLIGYGPDQYEEAELKSLETIRDFRGKYPVTWVLVDGLGDADTILQIGRIFNLHPLALEDVVNVHHRAKSEQYTETCFVIARIPILHEELRTDQLSLFLGPNFVVTFQERTNGSLDTIRERLRTARGQVRSKGADYLAYAILDVIIDNTFPVLENYGERLDGLEDEIINRAEKSTVNEIFRAKQDLLKLRRAIWPLRDVVGSLYRDVIPFITDETRVYLRDCYDHIVQIIDLLENYRQHGSDLMDFYLSSVSNRMNEVMKVLTVIATIFIPLTFIAGVYGMNFDPDVSPWNMPELRWIWGYPTCLAFMALVTGGLIGFFWKKGWLGSSDKEKRS